MKNDLSFIISSTLNLYEHQSTFNPNMPIRGLLYFARLYEDYIYEHNLNILGHRLVRLPTPQFIIFYNGRETQPDEIELCLSDSFEKMPDKSFAFPPALECRARMLNINLGHNEGLLEKCNRLKDYSTFISEVNYHLDKGYPLEDAINQAIDVCVAKGILSDILSKSRNEVFHLLLTEYNEKKHMKNLYQEGREDGLTQGNAEAILVLLEELGPVSDDLRNKILSETSIDLLQQWLKSAAKADSLESFLENFKVDKSPS